MEDYKKLGRLDLSPVRVPVVIQPDRGITMQPLLEPEKEDEGGLLVEYFELLLRHRTAILLLACGGALIAFLFCLVATPVYRARTSLDIQNLNADFMNMRAVAPTGQSAGGGNATPESYLQTEIKLLQSESLAHRVSEKMQDEAAKLQAHGSVFTNLREWLHLPGAQPPTAKDTVAYAADHIVVKPQGLTRIVEITCDSWDAKFAAAFCNKLTSEFALKDREVRWDEAQKTSEWLSRQLSDVREQLAVSERKLQKSAEGNGLLYGQQGGTVGEQKLRELQSEYNRAQADRIMKQAQYEISKSAPEDSLPSILDDNQLRDYQGKIVELQQQLAKLMPPLTDAHPTIRKLKAQIKELQANLASKKANVMERLGNEFQAAKHREDLLSKAYYGQERKVSQDMGRQSQLNMLQREVDAGRQLYQTLQERVKEAGFLSAMQASTIRVVDAASAPKLPISPRKIRDTVIGFILGALAGVAFSVFKDRTETVLRTPGESQRYLNVRELGVIPSARVGLSHAYIKRLSTPPKSAGLLTAQGSTGSKNEVVDLATWKAHASLVAEAYRSTTYSILLEAEDHDRGRSYVISSPNAGEGKTSVVCNLGIALAQANRRVLVIDGDLRKPRLHKSMGIPNDVGLRNVLRGDIDLEKAPLDRFCFPTQVSNLSVLPSGSGSEEPAGLLYSPRMKPLLERLTKEFDVVLFDTPPMLHLADARILAGRTDGVILVFRARSTDRENALNARDLFQHDRVRIVGTILNDFDPLSQGKTNYYSSYYAYQSTGGKS